MLEEIAKFQGFYVYPISFDAHVESTISHKLYSQSEMLQHFAMNVVAYLNESSNIRLLVLYKEGKHKGMAYTQC